MRSPHNRRAALSAFAGGPKPAKVVSAHQAIEIGVDAPLVYRLIFHRAPGSVSLGGMLVRNVVRESIA